MKLCKKIRIILANRPQIMRELVGGMIKRQDAMEIVGEVLNPVDLLVAVRETQADAVILAPNDARDVDLGSKLLIKYPNLIIVGLASRGENAFVEQLCPCRIEIVDASENVHRYLVRHRGLYGSRPAG